jgi:uncharacterized SAM-binding protein YcdF (DUF218 family)
MFRKQVKKYKNFCLVILITLISIIPVRFAIAYHQAPYPQAILTLGGGKERELFTARFAKNYPSLDIWVSSGLPPHQALAIFQSAGIPNKRLHLDYRAVDTVTNFTSLVTDFKQRRIHHVYLITSKTHMPRALVIATLVFGIQGIVVTPISFASPNAEEPFIHILRDCGRSLLWIVTGRTGASLKSH